MSRFHVECELWRNRSVQPNVLRDVYDGNVWKEFQSFRGVPFLSSSLGNWQACSERDLDGQ